jgi:xanthine dehydrogenase accessory factor
MDAALDALLAAPGEPAVLVTVAAVKGSAPREAGAKMAVRRDSIAGTIGGGHLEHTAIEIARAQLAAGDAATVRRFPLGAALGQCCGGSVQLLFEPVPARAAWVQAVAQAQREDRACVVVTAARASGAAGKLVVRNDGYCGSLGDAALDRAASELAATLYLRPPAAARPTQLLELADTLCLFDPIAPIDWHVVLFGAGHVGQALVRALAALPMRITWVDTREAIFPPQVPPNVAVVATDTPEAEVHAAPAGAYFVVMTHSHALDQTLAEHVLRRDDFAYFGLIGSATKRRSFERRLAARGIDTARMTCPIGVAGIADKRPAAIAIAVAAQLLQRREARACHCEPQGTNLKQRTA